MDRYGGGCCFVKVEAVVLFGGWFVVDLQCCFLSCAPTGLSGHHWSFVPKLVHWPRGKKSRDVLHRHEIRKSEKKYASVDTIDENAVSYFFLKI